MTRFARARGSKASNERLPEDATSWSTMKRQMEESKLSCTKSEDPIEDNRTNSERMKSSVSFNKNSKSNLWETFDVPDKTLISPATDKFYNVSDAGLSHIKKKKTEKLKSSKIMKHNISSNERTVKKVIGSTFVIESTNALSEENDIGKNCNNTFPKNKKSKQKINKNTGSDKYNSLEENLEIKLSSKFEKVNQKPLLNSSIKENKLKKNKSIVVQRNENEPVKARTVKTSYEPYGNRKTKYDNSVNQDNHNNYSFSNTKPQYESVGRMTKLSHFQGFTVKSEDADRLFNLKRDLQSKGVPKEKIEAALQIERRRAEKFLSREKKVVCYRCRKFGHSLADCPESGDPSGICFKCGSTDHSVKECRVVRSDSFKFAHCFICQEQGHISRQCPDNPRGLYPKGGACKLCGDVTHLKKDCPKVINEKEKNSLTVGVRHNNSIEGLDEELVEMKKSHSFKKLGIVKF